MFKPIHLLLFFISLFTQNLHAQKYKMQAEIGAGFTEFPFEEDKWHFDGYEWLKHRICLGPLLGFHLQKQTDKKWTFAFGLQYQRSKIKIVSDGVSVRTRSAFYDSTLYQYTQVQGFDKFSIPAMWSHKSDLGKVNFLFHIGFRANFILPWDQKVDFHEQHYGDTIYEKHSASKRDGSGVKPVFPIHGQGIVGMALANGNWELGMNAYLGYTIYFGSIPKMSTWPGTPLSRPWWNNDFVMSLKYRFSL